MRSRTTGCGLARGGSGWVYSRVLHATSSSPGAPAPSQARHHGHLALLLAALAALGPFSTDTYLPSFQEIGVEFGASQLLVQQTLTAYMLPYAVTALFHGPLSDALGRRPVIIS